MDANEWLLLLAVALPICGAPGLAILGRALGLRVGWVALGFPVLSFAALCALAQRAELPAGMVLEWPWIPSLGINISFLLDGLSLFFALIVSGVGVLIFFYANFYLDDSCRHPGRFYCYLTLFMAAMLGTVLANNLMLLFVFWELTGLMSFLLIGFLHHESNSRTGARQALLVTALTGLGLLAGVIMLRQAAGTFELAALLQAGLAPILEENRTWLNAALLLILVGAFGKSAQFPLHFWLPSAMAAPTPVSAYLHSATMVKLGVFLCARLFPLFNDTEFWLPWLTLAGFTTLWIGALMALLSHDLKAILAFSTVSQLGFLVGHYGLGAAGGVAYDFLHILSHVLYKGALFMIAGIVIHATGIQDIRLLGGLWRRMPWAAAACLIAAATMAGLPGTVGFLSKEAMLKEVLTAAAEVGGPGIYAAAAAGLAAILKVAFSFRLFVHVFLGKECDAARSHFHAPPGYILAPPLVLAAGALLLGLWPGALNPWIAAFAVGGLHQPTPPLAIWHGVNRELIAGAAVILIGCALFFRLDRNAWGRLGPPAWLRFDAHFEAALEWFALQARRLTRWLRADSPVDYLPLLLAFCLCVAAGFLVFALGAPPGEFGLQAAEPVWTGAALHPLRTFVAALIALAVFGVVVLRRWTTQLISLSVAGFLTTFYFVLYRAPDLALTQILIEVVTLFMILILLGRFPSSAELGEIIRRPTRLRRCFNLAVALGVGVLMTGLVWWFHPDPARDPERIGSFFASQTVPLAKGQNAVNTILVDFRGFDTLGEITVLVIAMLGGIGLFMRYKRTPEEYRLGPLGPPGLGIKHSEEDADASTPSAPNGPGTSPGNMRRAQPPAPRASASGASPPPSAGRWGPRSFILDSTVWLTFCLVNALAIYLLLRGHNAPGGGFIAGLATAISLILLSLSVGVATLHRWLRFDPVLLGAAGVALAVVTGLLPMAAGNPFLEHLHFHWRGVPWVGALDVGSPLLFDIGVYFAVVGVTCRMVFALAQSTQGLGALLLEQQRHYSSPVEQPIEGEAEVAAQPGSRA